MGVGTRVWAIGDCEYGTILALTADGARVRLGSGPVVTRPWPDLIGADELAEEARREAAYERYANGLGSEAGLAAAGLVNVLKGVR